MTDSTTPSTPSAPDKPPAADPLHRLQTSFLFQFVAALGFLWALTVAGIPCGLVFHKWFLTVYLDGYVRIAIAVAASFLPRLFLAPRTPKAAGDKKPSPSSPLEAITELANEFRQGVAKILRLLEELVSHEKGTGNREQGTEKKDV